MSHDPADLPGNRYGSIWDLVDLQQRTCSRVNERHGIKLEKPSRNAAALFSGRAAAWNEADGRITGGLIISPVKQHRRGFVSRPGPELSGTCADGEAPAPTALSTPVNFHPLVRHHNTRPRLLSTPTRLCSRNKGGRSRPGPQL